jgi:ABC-type nitrate/sulfonate/bicarbonate transport system permease component
MNANSSFQPDRPAFLVAAPDLWRWLSSLFAFLAIVAVWGVVAETLSRDLLPGPIMILRRICESWQTDPMITVVSGQPAGLGFHTWQTALRFLRYLSAGLVLGCVLLFLACLHKRSAWIMRLFTWIANPIPPLLLLPIIYAAGCPTAVLEWTGGIFYPALAVLSLGLGTLDDKVSSLEFLMKQAGAGPLWLTAHVRWPAVEAALLPTLKSHGAFTLGLTIVVEWMLAPNGLGRVMKYALSFNSGTLLLSAVMLVVLVATVYEVLIQFFVTVRLRWKANSHAF